MYIIIGISLVLFILVFLAAAKFTPDSEMMNSFEVGGFKKLMIGLSAAAVLSISYGVYQHVTYQLPFIDIKVGTKNYTIFGDIGEIGYFTDGLVTKGEETELYLVSWNGPISTDSNIVLTYPSGEMEAWQPRLAIADNQSIEAVKNNHNINEIYEASPFTFKEAGEVEVSVQDENDSITSFIIDVRQQ
ncbi:hypothetical protein E2R51_00350 [Jeotgalibacillus sp. S-D1]|uniref:hypothetical protein n=1 Tax=Jeotgalibacillus sp. S-D1 TaxID=2552189 RepID=UPI00105A17F7|nr:hypothetical protein [Jeotgalibacillus sp. S-D1]TDL34205.1 hypothetical protein E2R51_00350 [Jeotgalibacillus sp. S-D1]